jgi:ankyrin repeat protein
MEHAFRVGVTPLEAALKDPNDFAAFTAALSRRPSQAEKDAALPWVMVADVSHVQGAIIRTRRLAQLLAAGANVNQADRYGTTPLMQAVRTHGAESAVRLLIRAGANLNARDDRGKTVLDIAEAADCSPECRQVLVDAGATKSGQTTGR